TCSLGTKLYVLSSPVGPGSVQFAPEGVACAKLAQACAKARRPFWLAHACSASNSCFKVSRPRVSTDTAIPAESRASAKAEAGRRDKSRKAYSGPPALGPVPDSPSPPKGWTPTTAPTMLRLM